ncbi:hypothetical protein [Novosphingobium sp. PC22D]|uniref:hypothetical protein n=1 Tax=Novosphingobium sp. PC22D TaxID=1962403 RepID=UPI0011456298|nr:hypothetical protein [Novosphingobium sp. PC22D]
MRSPADKWDARPTDPAWQPTPKALHPAPRSRSKGRKPPLFCRWTSLASALGAFARHRGKVQSLGHILPLHWYVACRLVVEGGFAPDDIRPRPPFALEEIGDGEAILHFDPELGGSGEGIVLGALKAKHMDVLVTSERIGPVLAVSCKGVTGALRNLGNRLEEIIGENTNLHMTYPALVLAHLILVRMDKPPSSHVRRPLARDIRQAWLDLPDEEKCIGERLAPAIRRFVMGLEDLSQRRAVFDQPARCEAALLARIENGDPASQASSSCSLDPVAGRLDDLFASLYQAYDERFTLRSPELARVLRRRHWCAHSPGLRLFGLDYRARVRPEGDRS